MRGWISKTDSLTRLSVLDYPISTFMKPSITSHLFKTLETDNSGLNRKCVGGSQNGHQIPVQRHRFTLKMCLTSHYYSLKPLKPTFFWKTGDFPSLPVIGDDPNPAEYLPQPFSHRLQKSLGWYLRLVLRDAQSSFRVMKKKSSKVPREMIIDNITLNIS